MLRLKKSGRYSLFGLVLLALAGGLIILLTPGKYVLYTDDEVRFLQHMCVHHQQAVDMALLVPARTMRREFLRYASYVRRAQAAEIALMQSLLEQAAGRGQDVPEHRLHGDPPMAGMLSSAQMRALEGAAGAEFERLWLEGMIYHHRGAIDMASIQQRLQLEHQRRPYGLEVLVEDILVEQRYEITKMERWLWEWGLVRHTGAGQP
jgi:uncharacterized protein (DUF305 family)